MLDYENVFGYAQFWRKEIAPYLCHMIPGGTTFSEYVRAFYGRAVDNTFGIPLPFVYTMEFLKRYQNKCVSFLYNSPEEVQKGASMISAIYQMSPSLNSLANIHFWREEGESDGHVTLFCIYEKFHDVLQFTDDNLDIVKKPKEQFKGFAVVK